MATEETSTPAFFSADHITDAGAVEEADDSSADVDIDPESSQFTHFFEIDRVLSWIKDNDYKKIALQLPDGLLKYAVPLATKLEKDSGVKMYILADTSYRSCCVDAIAAEHSVCDALVHFGAACMSAPTDAIPVLYVFGKLQVDFADFEQQLCDSTISNSQNVMLLYEPGYEVISDDLASTIRKALTESSVVSVCHVSNDGNTAEGTSLGRVLPSTFDSNSPASLVFIGTTHSALLPIWLMTYINIDTVYHYSPATKVMEMTEPRSSRSLRKRLFLIEKVRDANIVGLVIGTLGVSGVKEAIQRIREMCKKAQKKIYVLSIGKVNEAKLSNFAADIDAFILLSCPFGIILNTGDFIKPVVSLFEAEIALNPSKSWFAAGGWTAQFNDFVKDEIGEQDADATDVSLISGKVRALRTNDLTSGAASDNMQVLEYDATSSFANRSWKGLDNTYVEEDLSLNEGLKGIAMTYCSEPPRSVQPKQE